MFIDDSSRGSKGSARGGALPLDREDAAPTLPSATATQIGADRDHYR
jgi:hypothetical protein